MTFTTNKLAAFASSITFDDLPDEVVTMTQRAVLDTLAAAIGGFNTNSAQLTRQVAKLSFGNGDGPVWFTGETLRPLGALLANCTAASVLDIDDGHRLAAGHPGAAIVPAVLMEAATKEMDGYKVITAIALGYDVALRIAAARRFTDSMSFASGRWTGFGVAAALGWLRGLETERIAHAIAIAGAEAPQNLPQGDCMTSSVKGSSPWSTVTASVAVDRAQMGMDGSIDLLDRDHAYDIGGISEALGDRWLIPETYLKPYAACRYVHAAIDAVLAITAKICDEDKDVERLLIEIFPEAQKLPNDIKPGSIEAAQFSIPFTAALAALRGAEAFRPLRPESLTDEQVLALAARVEVRYSDEFSDIFPKRLPARVTLTTHMGSQEACVETPLGDVENPMDRAAVEQKLHDLGHEVLSRAQRDTVISAVDGLRSGQSLPLLAELASAAAPR